MTDDDFSQVHRRQFLKWAGVAGVASLMGVSTARAASPVVKSFQIGEWETWSVQDGTTAFPGVLKMMEPASDHQAMEAALAAANVSADPVDFFFNILVLKNHSDLVVFDGGYGSSGPAGAGKLIGNLKSLGIDAEDVTHLFLSHAHPDHIAGMLGADGKPAFAKAKVLVSRQEHVFWSATQPDFSQSRLPAAKIAGMSKTAQGGLAALKSQIEVVDFDTAPLDGIRVLDGSGHTPGHAIYHITSGKDELFHISDLAHNHVLMFANPEWNIAFDINPGQAVERRKYWFSQLAKAQKPVFGYHLPSPALGQIATAGNGYKWVTQS